MNIRLLLLVSALATGAQGAELKAGLARVEITPSRLMEMYGYANRKCGPAATGTHDPLYAKALVLEAGGKRVAIVTLDLGSMVSDNLHREVAEKLDIPALLLAASHTHSAPRFLPSGSAPPSGEAAAYRSELERKIFGVVEEASKSMFPARLAVGGGAIQAGYNRLLRRDDGRARALFNNLERVPYGPVDPEFTLLGILDVEGRQKALLVHYATHAVVLGPTNCKYSADYPGVLQSRLEQDLSGAQVMFVQGGAGDINPLFMARSGNEDADFEVVRKMGELLASEVLRASKSMTQINSTEDSLDFHSETLQFKNRWDSAKSLDVGITTVLINDAIAIAAVPGEPMHKLQRMWKEQADVRYPLFYGYTSSAGGAWPGYIPDLRSAAYGGYGADASTNIEIGAGEQIMLRHLTNLYGLLGKWRDTPGRP